MKDYSAKYPKRKFTELFYADDEAISVDKVQAFLCPPNDSDTRWVPEKGYSVTVGHRLHETESAARRKLREDMTKERERLKRRLGKVDAFLGEAQE